MHVCMYGWMVLKTATQVAEYTRTDFGFLIGVLFPIISS